MCGVYFRKSFNLNLDILQDDKERLNKSRHRGPDSSTIDVFEDNVFGFNRLAIRDITGGKQPYFGSRNGFIACINGELYNEAKISDLLKAARNGITLPSGDMQILAEFIAEFGKDQLSELQGIFAGFMYFQKSNSVLLFRDKTGEKPLYYRKDESILYIASEIRCLLSSQQEFNVKDRRSIVTGNWSKSETFFSGISKVPPGSSVLIDLSTKTISSHKYWQWNSSRVKKGVSPKTSLKQIEDAVLESVSQQLVSDVPIATFLSGGLDSALMLSMINRASGSSLDSYTLDFEDSDFSEADLASQSARHLGSHHTTIRLNSIDIAELIPQVLKSMDTPVLDPACLGIYALSERVVADGFKVAISGDGGDELFRGYQVYKYTRYLSMLTAFPNLMQTLLHGIQVLDRGKNKYLGLQMLAKRAADVISHPELSIPEIALSPFGGTHLMKLLSSPEQDIKRDFISKRALDFDFEEYYRNKVLPEVFLLKADQMSMAHSLEIRNPLLDSNMLNLVNDLRIRGHKLPPKREIITSFLGPEFPVHVLRAKKHGFSIPLSKALSHLDEPDWNLESIGIYSKEASKSWVALREGDQSQSHSVWALLVLNEFINR